MAVVRGDANAVLKDLTLIAEDPGSQIRPQIYPRIASVKPEEGAYTKVPVPTHLPFPRKLEGERAKFGKDVNVVQQYDQDTYELTIELDSDLVRNGRAYDFSDLVAEASISARLFPDYVLSQAIIANGNAYDGAAFYANTHKFAKAGSNTINNLVAKTGQTVSQLATDLASALTSLKTFKDNAGKLLNPLVKQGQENLVIHCPVALEQAFRQLIFGSMIPIAAPVTTSGTAASPAAGNVLQGIADIIPDGYLDGSSATTWYLHYVGMPQKPFAFFENYGVQVSVLGFGSEYEVLNNKVVIALKNRFALGFYRFDRSIRVA